MSTLAALGATERFTAIIVLLTAVIGLLTILGGLAWKAGRAVVKQIEALKTLTNAVRDLATRLEALEAANPPRSTRPTQLRR
jgi:hypothetical protein